MSGSTVLSWILVPVIGCLLITGVAGAEDGNDASLPDYRWVVAEQKVIIRADQIGEHETTASLLPEGLTFAANGDLLLAACVWPRDDGRAIHGFGGHPGARTVILRSSDAGHTWTTKGEIKYKKSSVGPKGGGFTEGMVRLRSGRLVIVYFSIHYSFGTPKEMESVQWGVYSDDEGKTWHYAPMDISPFVAANFHQCTQIVETDDGTLVASFWGYPSPEALNSSMPSSGLVRSHDGGLTWGDANVLIETKPGTRMWFPENQIKPLADGRWLCTMRLNNSSVKGTPLTQCCSYSHDQGRTWTNPVRTRFHGGNAGLGVLPDGAVMLAQTQSYDEWESDEVWKSYSTSDVGLRYEISYDDGVTWPYTAPLYTVKPGSGEYRGGVIIRPLDDQTVIAVYHRGSKELAEKYGRAGPHFIGATWLRRVPADSPLAVELTYPGPNDHF